jgi:hypothetical protein
VPVWWTPRSGGAQLLGAFSLGDKITQEAKKKVKTRLHKKPKKQVQTKSENQRSSPQNEKGNV